MLGKIINGNLTYPPHRIVLDEMQIFNPSEYAQAWEDA